jgi:hypothetical protein
LLISDGPSVLALWQISLTKGAYRKAARCLNTKAAGQFSANLPLPGEMKLMENAPFADDVPMKLIFCSAT